MKKKIIFLPFIILIVYILVCPVDAVNAAASGLMLWYQKILPTLLPFSILSCILIDSNYLTHITRCLYPLTRWILPTSKNGSFAFLSGFLFGFPMGSKNSALLYQSGKISRKEAEYLAIVCNDISPVFVGSFVIMQQLHAPKLLLPAYLFLYLPPILLGNVLFRLPSFKAEQKNWRNSQKMPASGFQMNFKIIDTGIMNGFETLTKLGGYIMLFSMFASICKGIQLPSFVYSILVGLIELTNGIASLNPDTMHPAFCYVTALSVTAFGGLSGLAQTFSMTKECSFSKRRYLCCRVLLTLITGLSACAYCMLMPTSYLR